MEELFEARKHPKGEAEISDIDGIVHIVREDGRRRVIVSRSDTLTDEYTVPEGWTVLVSDGDMINAGEPIACQGTEEEPGEQILARHRGTVHRDGRLVRVTYERRDAREYEIPPTVRLLVAEGQYIKAGTQLAEGSRNPHRILQVLGREATQMYILSEVQKVYRSQGVNINDKHFEVIIRKMLGKMQVVDPGDTDLLPGDLVDRLALQEINRRAVAEGKQPAKARAVLLGVTKAALATDSFLSAASFQHTIRVLAKAAVEGQKDMLYGLKENVIIGKLIPAGTGYRGDSPDSDGPIPSYEGIPLRPAVLPAPPPPALAPKEEGLEEELELEKLMVGEESDDLLAVTTDLLEEDEEYGYEDLEEDEGDDEEDEMMD